MLFVKPYNLALKVPDLRLFRKMNYTRAKARGILFMQRQSGFRFAPGSLHPQFFKKLGMKTKVIKI